MANKSNAERVTTAKTPEQCEILAENALKKGNAELAMLARQRRVELRAAWGRFELYNTRLMQVAAAPASLKAFAPERREPAA